MSDQSGARPGEAQPGEAKPRGGFLKWALWGAALIGVAAVVYIMAQASTKPPPDAVAAKAPADAHNVAKMLTRGAAGSPSPDYTIYDAAGNPLKIADLKGKVVVMNLWATWCAPCKLEMPTLAKLQAAYAGKPVMVVAVSIDKADATAEARAFIAQNAPLAFFNDPDAKIPWTLNPPAQGMPTTVIYGKDGLERGRVAGDAEWATPDAKGVIDKILAEG